MLAILDRGQHRNFGKIYHTFGDTPEDPKWPVDPLWLSWGSVSDVFMLPPNIPNATAFFTPDNDLVLWQFGTMEEAQRLARDPLILQQSFCRQLVIVAKHVHE